MNPDGQPMLLQALYSQEASKRRRFEPQQHEVPNPKRRAPATPDIPAAQPDPVATPSPLDIPTAQPEPPESSPTQFYPPQTEPVEAPPLLDVPDAIHSAFRNRRGSTDAEPPAGEGDSLGGHGLIYCTCTNPCAWRECPTCHAYDDLLAQHAI